MVINVVVESGLRRGVVAEHVGSVGRVGSMVVVVVGLVGFLAGHHHRRRVSPFVL